jgi:hypothetical protein
LPPLLPLCRQRQQYLERARVQVVDGLETDSQIAVRARSRERDGAEFLRRQPVSVASNVDDRFGYSLARVPTLQLSLQAHSPQSRPDAQRRSGYPPGHVICPSTEVLSCQSGAVGFIGDLPQTFITGYQGRLAQGDEELRPLLGGQGLAGEREGRLFAADARAGEEITEARSVLALRLNEKLLPLAVAGVFQ